MAQSSIRYLNIKIHIDICGEAMMAVACTNIQHINQTRVGDRQQYHLFVTLDMWVWNKGDETNCCKILVMNTKRGTEFDCWKID